MSYYVGVRDDQEIVAAGTGHDAVAKCDGVQVVLPASAELYREVSAGRAVSWVVQKIDGVETAILEPHDDEE